MINVYDGIIGQITDTDKLYHELSKYIINNPEPLNYEIKESKSKVVIITGKNEEEKKIEPFNHPFIFKDMKGKNVIALDLRLYMKSNLEGMINVTDYLADRYNGMLQLRRLIFTKLMLDEEDDALAFVDKNLNLGFSSVISSVASMLVYDRSLNDISFTTAAIHYSTMDLDGEIDLPTLIDILPIRLSKRLMQGDLTDLYKKISVNWTNLVIPSKEPMDLIHNIQVLSNNDRVNGLTTDMFVNSISRMYYALNSKELALALMYNKPTFISAYYAALKEGINSKSIMRKILDSRKSIIKTKETIKVIEDIINDQIEAW
jgi:hypothetical protein